MKKNTGHNAPTQNNDRLIAFLASLCLFLSAIEYVIPKPLPFMRLGLANMPIIIALYLLNRKELFLLVLLKIIGQGFITGTFFSYIFLFSATGSFTAGLAMLFIHRIGKNAVSAVGISLIGSLANTTTQILMSRIILFGEAVQYIAPVLLVSGIITGLLLGFFTANFMHMSKWFSLVIHTQTKTPLPRNKIDKNGNTDE